LVCATNRDLAGMVREGQYREDLYYRISLIKMELPPLRSYKHNLRLLSRIMLQHAAERHGKKVTGISAEAMVILEAHDFPGNVRELKNTIEHAVIMTGGEEITPADLPSNLKVSGKPREAQAAPRRTLKELRELWLAPLETQYLSELLRECEGNVREAAKRAGVNAVTMYRLLKKRGLRLAREVRSD
jgi:DNA-binding NtrC family response regulator